MARKPMGTILFVDQVAENLESYCHLLEGEGFNLLTASSAEDALEALSRRSVDILVTEINLGVMSGSELLAEVSKRYPSVCRIVMSTCEDQAVINNVLVLGLATDYLISPCPKEMLCKSLHYNFEIRSLLNKPKLSNLMHDLSLPALPKVYQRFMEAIEGDLEIEEIVEVIEQDPVVVVILLHTVNSAFYGRSRNVRSVGQAIITLGLMTVKDIIFSISLHGAMSWTGKRKQEQERLFAHALLVNKLTGKIYRQLYGHALPREYSSIGITHDIGKLLILQHFEKRYFETYDFVIANKLPGFHPAEIELGYEDVTHAEIGGYFLGWWNLPLPLIEGALYHHTPEKGTLHMQHVLRALHIADLFALSYQYPELVEEHPALEEIMDSDVIVRIREQVQEFYDNVPPLSQL